MDLTKSSNPCAQGIGNIEMMVTYADIEDMGKGHILQHFNINYFV